MPKEFEKNECQFAPIAMASVLLTPLYKMFPLKLIRKTANGDLRLEGFPVYVAGTVATEGDLPVSGESIGESYVVGKDQFAVWIGKWIFYSHKNGESCDCPSDHDCEPMDADEMNQLLLQTGFPPIYNLTS